MIIRPTWKLFSLSWADIDKMGRFPIKWVLRSPSSLKPPYRVKGDPNLRKQLYHEEQAREAIPAPVTYKHQRNLFTLLVRHS